MSVNFKMIAGAGAACFVLALPLQAMAQDYGDDPQSQIERLSDQLRKLTGQNEELQHQNQLLQQQLQQLQAGGARPAEAPARNPPPPQQTQSYQGQSYQQNPPAQAQTYQQPQQGGYQPRSPFQDQAPINAPYSDNPPPVAASGGGSRGDAFDPGQNPNAPGVPRPLGSLQGQSNYVQPGAPISLEAPQQEGGYAPPQQPQPQQQPQQGASASLTTAPPSGNPKDEFDLGIGYMQRKDYDLAGETMRNFIAKYPNERLVGDAQYWLGESLFQRKQYRDAAEAFLAVTSKYDRSGKAPDAMLRLGQSLAALKQKDAACASFGEVLRKYPKASSGVKQGVAREQKREGC